MQLTGWLIRILTSPAATWSQECISCWRIFLQRQCEESWTWILTALQGCHPKSRTSQKIWKSEGWTGQLPIWEERRAPVRVCCSLMRWCLKQPEEGHGGWCEDRGELQDMTQSTAEASLRSPERSWPWLEELPLDQGSWASSHRVSTWTRCNTSWCWRVLRWGCQGGTTWWSCMTSLGCTSQSRLRLSSRGTSLTSFFSQANHMILGPNFDVVNSFLLPGNSPDCNPIEHCYRLVKRKLEKRPTKNLSELRRCQVQSIWTNLSDDYLFAMGDQQNIDCIEHLK